MELLAGAVIAGVVLAVLVFWIVWRAVGAVLDWIVYTFGNEEAVTRLKRRRNGR